MIKIKEMKVLFSIQYLVYLKTKNIINMITKGITFLELGKELQLYKSVILERLKEVNQQINIPEEDLRKWLLDIKSNLDKGINIKKQSQLL
ncbi:hypothetical protein ACTNDY_08385 [Tissierellaceae bacterium HCP3S3_D8]